MFELISFTNSILIGAAVALVFILARRRKRVKISKYKIYSRHKLEKSVFKGANEPPVMKGGNIIFGKLLEYFTNPYGLLKEIQEKHGGVVMSEGIFGLFRTALVSNYEAIEGLFRAGEEKVSLRMGVGIDLAPLFGDPEEVSKT